MKKKKGTWKKIKVTEENRLYHLSQYAKSSLGSRGLRDKVKLPEGEDRNEWFAFHITEFFNHVRIIYNAIGEHCTAQSCPTMTATPRFQYLWMVEEKKPLECTAPEYVDFLLTWIQELINDENVFPSSVGAQFPENFTKVVKNIVKRIFRVYAHIYIHHMNGIEELNMTSHLNTSFKHLLFFGDEFNLIPAKEKEPLQEFIDSINQDMSNN